MVAVVAAVGREIEGDAEAFLSGGEVLAVEGVGLTRRREAGVLPDSPRAVGVHGGAHTACVGGGARDADVAGIVGEVGGLDREAAIIAIERVDGRVLELARGELGPFGEGRAASHQTASNSRITSSTASTAPGLTRILLTRDRRSALRTFSIFMASTMARGWPDSTTSPSLTSMRTIWPGIGQSRNLLRSGGTLIGISGTRSATAGSSTRAMRS